MMELLDSNQVGLILIIEYWTSLAIGMVVFVFRKIVTDNLLFSIRQENDAWRSDSNEGYGWNLHPHFPLFSIRKNMQILSLKSRSFF